jgi:hypothetical protein
MYECPNNSNEAVPVHDQLEKPTAPKNLLKLSGSIHDKKERLVIQHAFVISSVANEDGIPDYIVKTGTSVPICDVAHGYFSGLKSQQFDEKTAQQTSVYVSAMCDQQFQRNCTAITRCCEKNPDVQRFYDELKGRTGSRMVLTRDTHHRMLQSERVQYRYHRSASVDSRPQLPPRNAL